MDDPKKSLRRQDSQHYDECHSDDPLYTPEDYRFTLRPFFWPRAVVVVGATDRPGHVGRTVLSNLKGSTFDGVLYGVNPKRESVLGVKCFTKLSEVPEVPDLVLIVTPAVTVPGLVGECVDIGVKAVIIISAGFKEVGPEGKALEDAIMGHVRRSENRTRVIGPNCLGVQCPISGLNGTFATQMALKGRVAFISQSGAMCTAVLDWTMTSGVGFSHFVSIGSMLDVNWADLINYLGEDEQTSCILIYMETVGAAREFLSAARGVSFVKPIIVLKAGRTQAAAAAAVSHTGSLSGSDDVLDCAFRRAGVVRVNTINELFQLAEVLSHQPIPRGPTLTIITNAGGPGVMAVDALVQYGGQLATLEPETMDALNKLLPDAWSHANPIDLLGSATAEVYAQALDIVARDRSTDGILSILVPVGVNNSVQTAQAVRLFAREVSVPLLAVFSGGEEVQPAKTMLTRAGVPTFNYADDACRMFDLMWEYRKNLIETTQTATMRSIRDVDAPRVAKEVVTILKQVHNEGRTLLTEVESKHILNIYNIPVVRSVVCRNQKEAVAAARDIGFPVVLKIHSETITHKSDVGGVMLNVNSDDQVTFAFDAIRENVSKIVGDVEKHFLGVSVQPMIQRGGSYELIIGSTVDPQFGPVMVFGTGGEMVEVLRDRSLALPPLNSVLARRMIESTKAYHALKGVRGRGPVDFEQLESILVNVSRLITTHPEIKELDINPLLASESRIIAVDARVVLHENSAVAPISLAIRPYPVEYVFPDNEDRKGQKVLVRPLRWEDEAKVIKFHKSLSENSVTGYYGRFVPLEERISHAALVRFAFIDYSREIVLIAENEQEDIMGFVRVQNIEGTQFARYTSLVADPFQGRGIASMLTQKMILVARCEGFECLVHDPSQPMDEHYHRIVGRFGFHLEDVTVRGRSSRLYCLRMFPDVAAGWG